MPPHDYKGIPQTPIEISSSFDCVGLELVDIYLWIFKRYKENKELSPELLILLASQANYGRTSEVSLKALDERWGKWFNNRSKLSEFTEERKLKSKKMLEFQEIQRKKAVDEAETL